MKLKIALPKGSLQKPTLELFAKAGFEIQVSERSYTPYMEDDRFECILLRAQEIAKMVERGIVDIGITGNDWIAESEASVTEICELKYAKNGLRSVKWVIAVPNDSSIKKTSDLEGKRIATEVINITNLFLEKNAINAKVNFSWGATEIKTKLGFDAIVDVTETGNSLRANNLRILTTILESTPRLIANKTLSKEKKELVDELEMFLKGAMKGATNVGLMMNVESKNIGEIIAVLPALQKPTISPLSDSNWVDVLTIVEKKDVKKLIVGLKKAGAQGIVEFPIHKIIV